MVDIDSKTLFNGAAAIVATIAVVVFVLNVEFGYSPVSKVALVVLFLSGIFALTQRTADQQLTLLGYGVIVTSGIALFFDIVNTFDSGNTVTVVGLLAIAAILFGLRTRLDDDNRFVTGRQALAAVGVLAVLTVLILSVDVVTGGLAYELQLQDDVTAPDSRHGELRVGSVQVTNPTPLPERVEAPTYAACTAGDWSSYRRDPPEPGEEPPPVRANLNVQDGYNEHVLSFGSRTYPVVLYLDGTDLGGDSVPVERTESCPETETGSPYLAVYEAPTDRPRGRPV